MWQLWFHCYALDLSLYDCCFNHNVNRHFFKKPENLGARWEDTERAGRWWHGSFGWSRFPPWENPVSALLCGGVSQHPDAGKQWVAGRLTLTGPGTSELQWMDARYFFWLHCCACSGPSETLKLWTVGGVEIIWFTVKRTGPNIYLHFFKIIFSFPRPTLSFAAQGLIVPCLHCNWDVEMIRKWVFTATSKARARTGLNPALGWLAVGEPHALPLDHLCPVTTLPGHVHPDTSSRSTSLRLLKDRVFLASIINYSPSLKNNQEKKQDCSRSY